MIEFVFVAHTGDIPPGKMKRVNVGSRRILIANVAGEFLATQDTCSHEDASLSTGSLHGDLVKCPLHGSRFNLRTGQVLDEPAEENLQTYPVRIDGERISVGITEGV